MATKDSGRRSTRRQTTRKPAESPAPPAAQAPQRSTGRKRATPRPRPAEATAATAAPETASTIQATPAKTPAPVDTAEEQETPRQAEAPVVEPSALDIAAPPGEGEETIPTAEQPEQPDEAVDIDLAESEPGRRERQRPLHGNALGTLIERQFSAPGSPCRSYSDLERRSGISREALSRYVTARADRRRSPTIDTLVAIADALHLSLDAVCRAAAASVKGFPLPEEEVRRAREEVLSPLVSGLSPDQFNAVAELLRLMRPAGS